MARKSRQISKTGIYHVIIRGYDDLFLSDADREEFYSILKRYFSSPDAELYAYSIENDKVHMVLYAGIGINFVMKPLCTSYARYYNRTYDNSGKIFYDRFISVPIESDDMLRDVIIFVNSKPGAKTSIDEYRKKADLCSVDTIKEKIGTQKIVKPSGIKLMTDDYNYMEDNELKNIISVTYNINPEILEKTEKLRIIEDIISSANLSKSRLCRIFDIIAPVSPKKKAVEKINEENNDNNNDTDTNKNNLSVWLL